MNCQEIASLLDDADIGALDESMLAAVERHVAGCADCAAEWRVHRQLVSRALPDLPSGLALRCRETFAGDAGRQKQTRRRPVILGSLAALAAAAAVVGVQGLRGPDETPAAVSIPRVASVGTAMTPDEVRVVPVAEEPQPQPAQEVATVQLPQVRALPRIELGPLQQQSKDPRVNASVEAFRTELLAALQQLEGYEVSDDSSAADGAPPPAMRITLRAVDSNLAGFEWQAVARAERLTGRPMGFTTEAIAGSFDRSRCMPAGGGCTQQAERLLAEIRRVLFPDDAGLISSSRERLIDPSQPWSARRTALQELTQTAKMRDGTPMLDADAIRVAVDLAAAAPNHAARRAVWGMLKGFSQPELVPPLVQALNQESDPATKLAIAALLGTEHAADAAARAALQAVAQGESRESIRMAVGQYLSADRAAAWNKYVTDALRDAHRPAPDRLEPFLLMQQQALREPSYFGGEKRRQMAAMIEGESGTALAALLPGYWKDHPTEADMPMLAILGYYSMTRHPAGPGLMIEASRSDASMLRNEAAHIMDRYYRDEPGVKQALEEVAARDPAIRRSLEFRAAGGDTRPRALQEPTR